MRAVWRLSRELRIAAALLIVSLPVLIASELSVASTEAQVRASNLARQTEAAETIASVAQHAVLDVRDALVAATKEPALRDAAVRRDRSALTASLVAIRPLLGQDVLSMITVGTDGILDSVDPPSPGVVGTSRATRDYFIGATQSGRPYVSEVFTTARTGNPPAANVAVPLRDTQGQLTGVLVVSLDLGHLARWISPALNARQDVYLVDQHGKLIIRGRDPGADVLRDLSADPTVAAALGGARVRSEGDDPLGGGPSLIASAPVPDLGWNVIVVRPVGVLEEDLAPLVGGARRVELVLGLVAMAGVAVMSWVSRRSSRQRAALLAANAALEVTSRHKSQFLANMSHELRTPLNAILGFSQLLEERAGTSLEERQRRWLRNIQTAGTHLLDLINEVLDISKVEAGRYEIRPEPISLVDLLAPVLATARQDAEARGLTFEASEVPAIAVLLDPLRTRQILLNLVSNAVKFTEPGGHVDLAVGVAGNDLRFVVSDTGIGIPAGEQDRVFGVFERLHEGRYAAAGSGLGLALSKRIVELAGGSISFTSEEGVGTTFSVSFPRAVHAEMVGRRVLIVEDDPRDAALVAALAEDVGQPVEIVVTGAAALASVRRDPPTAIVLDLRLPDTPGEAVLEALRAAGVTPRIPVIVVTNEDDDGRTRLLGAAEHLTKPIDGARLRRWLESVAEDQGGGA